MWKGSSALNQLDNSLKGLRGDVIRLDSDLSQLSHRLTSNERQRVQLLNGIAKVRLSEIESGQLNASVLAADQEAAQLLDQRQAELAKLTDAIDRIENRISDAEEARLDLLLASNEAEQALTELENQVQTDLQNDAAYIAQFEAARQAESIAEEALLKVQTAQSNLAAKAAPYEADELFMYLWKRGFGTTAYKANFLARFIDSWLARLISYSDARINFWNLSEIPKRLQAHADQVSSNADREHTKLQQLERDALASAGKDQAEKRVDQARNALDAHDDSLEALEKGLDDKLNERASYLAGEDRFTRQCLSRLSQAVEHQDQSQLERSVRDTVSARDDQLAIQLIDLQEQMSGMRDDLQDVRNVHQSKLSRLRDLESVRQKFKHSRFDDVRSGFGNKAVIASALGQFLQGLVNGNDLWQLIKRNQRYRDVGGRPDFGSGALGEIADAIGDELLRQGRRRTSRHRTTWSWPRQRQGGARGGGFRFPSSGGSRRSGGGFKTGGGF